ncbi:MAG: sulfotransferase family 2 domain-containing protein [Pseudomonadota bacterium]
MPAERFRYFVIFGAMRTGSNLLEGLLAKYVGLAGAGELFNPQFIGKPNREEHLGVSLELRKHRPLDLIEAVIAAEGERIPGFRLFDGHDRRVLDHAAGDPACARILLTRNPIDSYISMAIARTTGQWMLRDPKARKFEKIRFDADEYAAFARSRAAFYNDVRRKIRAVGGAFFEIDYDELLDLELINGLARFIGSEEVKSRLVPPVQKQNPADWEQKVKNPDAVRAVLGGVETRSSAPARVEFDPHTRFLAARGAKLIASPIPGAGTGAIRALMQGLDPTAGLDAGGAGLGAMVLQRRRRLGHSVIAMVRHPGARTLALFAKLLDAEDVGEMSALRTMLDLRFGASALEKMGEDPEVAANGFDLFLSMIEDAAAAWPRFGQAIALAPQSEFLDGYAAAAPPDRLIRAESARGPMTEVLGALGLAPTEEQIAKFEADLAREIDNPVLNSLMTTEREARLRKIYQADYDRLGYGALAS